MPADECGTSLPAMSSGCEHSAAKSAALRTAASRSPQASETTAARSPARRDNHVRSASGSSVKPSTKPGPRSLGGCRMRTLADLVRSPLLYTAKLRAAWLVGANVPNLKTVPRAGLRALLHSAIWAAPEGPRGDMGSVALISDERRGRRSPSTYLASGLRRAGISSTRQTQKSEGPRLWHRRPRGIVRSACSRKTIRNSRLGGSMVLRQRNCRHGIAG